MNLSPTEKENIKNALFEGWQDAVPDDATKTYFKVIWKNQSFYIPTGGEFDSKARAYQSSQQSIDSGDATKINLQTENYDVNSEFANSRFTAKIAGYYQVNASILWLASADTKVCQTQIRVKGDVAAADAKRSPGTGYISSNISDIVYLDVDDYVEMYGYQDSGGSVNLNNNSQSTFMSVHRLS